MESESDTFKDPYFQLTWTTFKAELFITCLVFLLKPERLFIVRKTIKSRQRAGDISGRAITGI